MERTYATERGGFESDQAVGGFPRADVSGCGGDPDDRVRAQAADDALVDFCFNLGSGRLASSTLLKALNGGRYEAAREQLLRWDQAGGQVRAGLKARREAESALWGGVVAVEVGPEVSRKSPGVRAA